MKFIEIPLLIGAVVLTERVAHYFLSPRPSQENLNEAIDEAMRNPIIQKLYNQTSKNHKISISLKDRSCFLENGMSMAHHFVGKNLETGENESYIEIWDGNRSFKNFIFDLYETADYYHSPTNPIIWNANPLLLVIFELINAFQRKKFSTLKKLALKGEIDRKEYVVLTEFVELGTLILFSHVNQYGIEHMDWDPKWFHIGNQNYRIKSLEKGQMQFFKEQDWPMCIFEPPGKISHARIYSNLWYELGFSKFFKNYFNSETPKLLESVRQAPIEAWKKYIGALYPGIDFDGCVEHEDYAMCFCIEAGALRENAQLFFEHQAVQNECLSIGIEGGKFNFHTFRIFIEHLGEKYKLLNHLFEELKEDPSKITEKAFADLSLNAHGRCLLRILEDSLFEQEDPNQKMDLEYLKAFVKKNEFEDLKLHITWLLDENSSSSLTTSKSVAPTA